MLLLFVKMVLLICLCGGTERLLAAGQHYKRLRPVPTDKMPIPVLEEDPSREFDPTSNDIDERVLLDMLDVDYLPSFMSSTYPRDFDSDKMKKPLSNRFPSEIRKLFKRNNRAQRPRKLWRKVMKHKRIIQAWLHQETACPVRYRWKDLGLRFWPRFIKEGYCDSSKSCSIPAGMKCKSSAQSKIVILRWYCQGILEHKYCSWIHIQYPVVSECKCQC